MAQVAFDARILKNSLWWAIAVAGVDVAFAGGFFQRTHANLSENRSR